MQLAILGPLEVVGDDGRARDVGGARLRALLLRLALDPGRTVGVAALTDAVWGERSPAEAGNALQTLVSRLRRALGDAATITSGPSGYRLAVAPDDVDAHRFRALAADGAAALAAGEAPRAARVLADALALWRGPALVDAPDTLAVQAARLEELRLGAQADRIEADLASGRTSGLVAELEELAEQHPLDERLAALLVRSLAGAGRQADALAAYERVRGRLADELGVDPSPALREVHLAALRGELDAPAAAPTPEPFAPARRTNLRAQLTSFVGREEEVARIGKSLELSRLVTLVGPGGAGKTRLAAEAGRQVESDEGAARDGVWLVELAPVTTGADVAGAVLAALGLREMTVREVRAPAAARDAQTRLLMGLADKRLLLVLDNCEHLIEATAHLADTLLAHCPDLHILATSREPLGIVGEVLLAVPPLGQPAAGACAAEALEYPAVRLFADRAAAVLPDFTIGDADVPIVVEIVRRLDGLPLAIELAAARLRTMPLADIAGRLDSRFRLLTGGSRTALPRHRTLRAVVEWSWDLLDDAERRVAERLSVFTAGVTEAAAAAVLDLEPADAADLLASLTDRSLLQPVDGGRRLRMLETIREFGAERLGEQGELAPVRAAHAAYFAGVLAQAQPHLLTREQVPWFAWIDAERENILTAMRYLGDVGETDAALTIAMNLCCYAMMVGAHAELTGWLAEALSVPGGTDPQLRLFVEALLVLNNAASATPTGTVVDEVGDTPQQTMAHYAKGLRELDDEWSPFLPMVRAVLAFFAQDDELADEYVRPSRETPPDDDWAAASLAMMRANLADNRGDMAGVRVHGGEALARFRRIGERWGLANALRMMAQVHTLDGDFDAATEAYGEARALTAELNSRDDESFMLAQLAELELRRGDVEAARRYVLEARRSAEAQDEAMEVGYTAVMLASVEEASGDLDAARTLNHEALERIRHLPAEHPALGHIRAMSLMVSARLGAAHGDLTEARAAAAEAYEAACGTNDRPVIAAVGTSIAHVAVESGDALGAAEILGACTRLRGAADPTSPYVAPLVERLRATLGDDVYAAAYERGEALDRDAAVERLRPPW